MSGRRCIERCFDSTRDRTCAMREIDCRWEEPAVAEVMSNARYLDKIRFGGILA
jgi:hypothetical protein